MNVRIPLQKVIYSNGLPLVTTDDGVFCFLVDTGASFNVLLEDAYTSSKKQFTKLGQNNYLLGMNGEPQKIFIVSGKIKMGGVEFEAEFGVMGNTEAIDTVRIISGRHIDGAIGVEFLMRYGLTLDFRECLIHD